MQTRHHQVPSVLQHPRRTRPTSLVVTVMVMVMVMVVVMVVVVVMV
jgi:t-SNARE complex subunit (syntaxin)